MDNYISSANDEMLDEFLMHYGVGPDDNPPGRGSGRYAKGSGDNPLQHDTSILGVVADMKKQGMSESEIALALGFVNRKGKPSTTSLRAAQSIAKDQRKLDLSQMVPRYKESGMSNQAIASKLGISESSVRNYLDKDRTIQLGKATNVANRLKEELKTKHYIDVGPGVELENNVSAERMKTALEMMKQEGYKIHLVNVEQVGNPGKYTTIKVVGEPDTEWKTVVQDPSLIKPFQSYAQNDCETVLGLRPVKSIDSKRVYINYTDENGKGGAEKDGTIELRRGVEDISLGNSRYAQVRIGVDGTHYMKGMAIYSDNIPDGYDVVYNTNKKIGTPPEDVFKPMKRVKDPDGSDGPINQENPFGASIKPFNAGGQSYCLDKNGNPTDQLRVINKINDQGDYAEWSKTISAQVLAKQPLPLIRRQLELTYQDKVEQYNTIKSLDNPTIKKKLLESFADDCDASAVHLKAQAFPGQASHAIIPIPSLAGDDNYKKKHGVDGEIYAPNYENGTTVALIRYPHAGTFEIPILRVNNNNKEGRAVLGNAPDAVGINAKIAERLSGADFDGDTVSVIPTTHTNILSTPRLDGLKNFDPKMYKFADPNAPGIKSQTKQTEMGKVTNLIADMQIKGAKPEEIVRAVKHSMVVIDSEKHHLDYKASEADNRIKELKELYQRTSEGTGASTLITRAGSEKHIPERKVGSVEITDPDTGKTRKYYGVDPRTGEKVLVPTGNTYEKDGKTVTRTETVPWMSIKTDARELMSSRSNPNPVELAYANYANRMKAMALEARKEAVNTPGLKRDPQAAREYREEVDTLTSKLNIALKNAPKERQAQIIANVTYKNQIESNPSLKEDKTYLKRLRGQALDAARRRIGAGKTRIDITDREWEAIQKGAISDAKLRKILDNTKSEEIVKRATPRENKALSASREALAKTMAASGYTQAEIAQRLGVSVTTVSKAING